MRGSIVGGVLSAVFGVAFFLSGVFLLGAMIYYNIKYGPIEPSGGDNEALDRIALTIQNVSFAVFASIAGMVGCCAARFWFKQKHRTAGLLTFLMFLFAGIATAFLTPR